MPQFTVIVTEHFVSRFVVEAENEDLAQEQASNLAVQGAFEQGESLSCERTTFVQEEA